MYLPGVGSKLVFCSRVLLFWRGVAFPGFDLSTSVRHTVPPRRGDLLTHSLILSSSHLLLSKVKSVSLSQEMATPVSCLVLPCSLSVTPSHVRRTTHSKSTGHTPGRTPGRFRRRRNMIAFVCTRCFVLLHVLAFHVQRKNVPLPEDKK